MRLTAAAPDDAQGFRRTAMSQETLVQVIQRASTDATFRGRLQRDPTAMLAEYDLSDEERAAFMRGDAVPLESRGVDARVTKQVGNPGPGPIEIPPPSMGPFIS
jgi:hypothetical protein